MPIGQVEFIRQLLREAQQSVDSEQATGDAEITDITAECYKLMMTAPELLLEMLASHDYHVKREMAYFTALEEVQALVAAGEPQESVLKAIQDAWEKAAVPDGEKESEASPEPETLETKTKWDYKKLLAELEEDKDATKYPHVKLRLQWPDGTGETPWGRDLGGGLVLLANSTVYPKYRFHDILTEDHEILQRFLPTKVVYQYTPLDGKPLDGEQDVDLPRRKALSDAITSVEGAHSHFFAQGQGYVLCEPDTELPALREAMVLTGFVVEEPMVQGFNLDTNEYSYSEITWET